MATPSIKYLVSLLILALVMTCVISARILDEETTVVAPTTGAAAGAVGATTGAVGATTSAVGATTGAVGATTGAVGITTDAVGATGAVGATTGAVGVTTGAVGATTDAVGATGAAATTGAAAGAATAEGGHALIFFMHDILGGTTPSATAVTGVVNNPAVNGQVPFAKRNGANLPINNGVSGNNNANNGAINNNNNIPFLTGLSGTTPNVIQNNNGNNNNNNFNGGSGFNQLPTGPAIEKLMFGTMTVFDDELTEGEDLGSAMVGKAQGFYVTSAQDGLSQTMAFTTMFESGGYTDSLSFFGIHRAAVSESNLAVMGGTGKYVNAKGFAIVKTFPATNQHSGDGVETVLEISVYLSY